MLTNPYVCKTCGHLRAVHSQGLFRCYSGGKTAWCKCQAYVGPQPSNLKVPR